MNHFEAIAQKLPEEDLDAVLLICAENRFYASGFRSHGGDGAALITKDGAYFWTDMRYIEDAQAQIQGARVSLIDRQNPYQAVIADVLRRHGVKRLGMDAAYISHREYEFYRKKLPCELTDATDFLAQLRAVKDPEELSRMEMAQRIAEAALTEVLNDIRPGVTERFLAARLVFLMLAGGADNVSFDPIAISGPKTSVPHGVPSERQVEAGDFVTLDFGALYGGYCSDMTRTVAVGHVTEEMEAVYDTVLRAQLAGIAAARAGIPGREIDAAARTVIEAAGYAAYFGHGFGHGLGVEIHEPPNVNPSNDRPLPVGAVISAEPGIYLPGRFGVRIEDMLVLEEGGCRNLTTAPKQLLVL